MDNALISTCFFGKKFAALSTGAQSLALGKTGSFDLKNFVIKAVTTVCVVVAFFLWWTSSPPFPDTSGEETKILRIYNWARYLPDDVIQGFEKEYGVKVVYDVFETTETLEARLSAGRLGYDLIFPSAWPTCAQFLGSGAFLTLDLKRLANFKNLDPWLLDHLRVIDPSNQHLVPYMWGTTGMAYDAKKVKLLAPDAPVDSWALLFDPQWAQKLHRSRIALLDSPTDVFPGVLCYIGERPDNFSPDVLEKAGKVLAAVRPWIAKFESSQTVQDLISGHTCAAQIFSTYGHMAVQEARKTPEGPDIRYVIPKEGAILWIDVIAIPKDAPNPDLAYLFIDYCLRPEVAAVLTTRLGAANGVPRSRALLPQEVTEDQGIYPPEDVLKRLTVERLPPQPYRKSRLRLWTAIRTGH
jgi:putrescine transport system substrate-binding protein